MRAIANSIAEVVARLSPRFDDILTTLATALIIAYLALGFRVHNYPCRIPRAITEYSQDEIDIHQSYTVCTQMLRVGLP
jgi:hypothetical protein